MCCALTEERPPEDGRSLYGRLGSPISPQFLSLQMKIYTKQKSDDQYEQIKTNNREIEDPKSIPAYRAEQDQEQIKQK